MGLAKLERDPATPGADTEVQHRDDFIPGVDPLLHLHILRREGASHIGREDGFGLNLRTVSAGANQIRSRWALA